MDRQVSVTASLARIANDYREDKQEQQTARTQAAKSKVTTEVKPLELKDFERVTAALAAVQGISPEQASQRLLENDYPEGVPDATAVAPAEKPSDAEIVGDVPHVAPLIDAFENNSAIKVAEALEKASKQSASRAQRNRKPSYTPS